MRGRTPTRTSGAILEIWRADVPRKIFLISASSLSVASSVEPRSRKRSASTPQRAICRRLTSPALVAARAQGSPDDPAIRVRSRSKKAAERPSSTASTASGMLRFASAAGGSAAPGLGDC